MEGCRVGLGFDVHKISVRKKPLILGGAKITGSFGLEAVSDGDVVLHAVSDSLCGACGLGDIGDYFPPQHKKSKGISSKKILNFVLGKINNKYKILNIDIIIIADKPRLVSNKKDILRSLKRNLVISSVNVKIKSREGMNILGNKNSISCLSTVLVKKIK